MLENGETRIQSSHYSARASRYGTFPPPTVSPLSLKAIPRKMFGPFLFIAGLISLLNCQLPPVFSQGELFPMPSLLAQDDCSNDECCRNRFPGNPMIGQSSMFDDSCPWGTPLDLGIDCIGGAKCRWCCTLPLDPRCSDTQFTCKAESAAVSKRPPPEPTQPPRRRHRRAKTTAGKTRGGVSSRGSDGGKKPASPQKTSPTTTSSSEGGGDAAASSSSSSPLPSSPQSPSSPTAPPQQASSPHGEGHGNSTAAPPSTSSAPPPHPSLSHHQDPAVSPSRQQQQQQQKPSPHTTNRNSSGRHHTQQNFPPITDSSSESRSSGEEVIKELTGKDRKKNDVRTLASLAVAAAIIGSLCLALCVTCCERYFRRRRQCCCFTLQFSFEHGGGKTCFEEVCCCWKLCDVFLGYDEVKAAVASSESKHLSSLEDANGNAPCKAVTKAAVVSLSKGMAGHLLPGSSSSSSGSSNTAPESGAGTNKQVQPAAGVSSSSLSPEKQGSRSPSTFDEPPGAFDAQFFD